MLRHILLSRFVITLAAVLLLAACGSKEKNPFCDNVMTLSADSKLREASADIIISGDTMPQVNDIIIVGDNLVADVDDKDGRLQVFSLDGTRTGKFGKFGRAENEYTSGMSFIGQPDEKCLYLRDVNKAIIAVMDMDSLRHNGEVIYKRIVKSFPRVLNAFISGDSELIYEHETPGSYALASRDIDTGSQSWEEILYEPTANPFSEYHSYMVMSDKRKKIAAAMRFRSQINFLDLNTKERKSFIADSDNNPSSVTDGHEYYCNIKANDDYVFALYMNQSAEDSYDVAKPMEIHVFDWDGNFIESVKVKEYIVRIAVGSDGTIYGKDLDGNIYRYSNFRKCEN